MNNPGVFIPLQNTGGDPSGDDSKLMTRREARALLRAMQRNSFPYELEPAEVLDVMLDPNDARVIEDPTLYGSIIVRREVSQHDESVESVSNLEYRPLDPNTIQYPVVGEIVLTFHWGNFGYYTLKRNNKGAFGSRQNTEFGNSNTGNPNANVGSRINPNSEDRNLGEYFEENLNVKKERAFEGDTIFQGRHGNTIRLGSNQSGFYSKDNNPKDGKIDSPNIKLSVGQDYTQEGLLHTENLDNDQNSIHMVTDELPVITTSIKPPDDIVGFEYDKSQIIITSNRILFNAREENISITSGKNIFVGSKENIVLDSPSVTIGKYPASEPQVLGQTLYEKLDALVTAIGNVTGIPTPTGPTPGPVSAAPSWPAVTSALKDVEKALSSQHRIDK